jgi:hypothetical protein
MYVWVVVGVCGGGVASAADSDCNAATTTVDQMIWYSCSSDDARVLLLLSHLSEAELISANPRSPTHPRVRVRVHLHILRVKVS